MASRKKLIDLHISPKLTNVLERISNKSEIARMLLRHQFEKEELVDDHIDFISISKEDPTKLTYLTNVKIAKSGVDKNDIDAIWSLNKVPSKPGVAFKKLFKEVHEKDVEIFTNLFKAAVSQKDFEMKIIQGDEMIKYYGYRSYHPEIPGTLHNSCMKHDHCRNYFDVYTKNPEVCKMLVMLDAQGRLLGRTLLWNAIDADNGSEVLVMDRIYCVDDSKNMHYFKEWADAHGYIYKKEQKWQNCMMFESHGSTRFVKLHVNLKKVSFVMYPYVDTFKFWDEKNSIICNYLKPDNGYIRTLMGNNGNTLGGDMLGLDTIQKIYVHREHLIYLPYIDGRIHADYSIWSETMQTSIARDHAVYNEDIKDYIFNEEYSKFNDLVKFNARKEQIRRLNEQKSRKMVSSRKSRSSNSEYYNGGFVIEDEYEDIIEQAPPAPRPQANTGFRATATQANNMFDTWMFDDVVQDIQPQNEEQAPEVPVNHTPVVPAAGVTLPGFLPNLLEEYEQVRRERRGGDARRPTARPAGRAARATRPAGGTERARPVNDRPAAEDNAAQRLAINNNTVLDQLLNELEQAIQDMNNDAA